MLISCSLDVHERETPTTHLPPTLPALSAALSLGEDLEGTGTLTTAGSLPTTADLPDTVLLAGSAVTRSTSVGTDDGVRPPTGAPPARKRRGDRKGLLASRSSSVASDANARPETAEGKDAEGKDGGRCVLGCGCSSCFAKCVPVLLPV